MILGGEQGVFLVVTFFIGRVWLRFEWSRVHLTGGRGEAKVCSLPTENQQTALDRQHDTQASLIEHFHMTHSMMGMGIRVITAMMK